MAKKFGKFLLFAAAVSAAVGAYYYMKEKNEPILLGEEDEDFDDFDFEDEEDEEDEEAQKPFEGEKIEEFFDDEDEEGDTNE